MVGLGLLGALLKQSVEGEAELFSADCSQHFTHWLAFPAVEGTLSVVATFYLWTVEKKPGLSLRQVPVTAESLLSMTTDGPPAVCGVGHLQQKEEAWPKTKRLMIPALEPWLHLRLGDSESLWRSVGIHIFKEVSSVISYTPNWESYPSAHYLQFK